MPLDVDAVVARQQLEELEKLLGRLPHMGRTEFCDDLIEFTEKMTAKYFPEPDKHE